MARGNKGRHGKGAGKGQVAATVLLMLLLAAATAFGAVLVFRPAFAQPLLEAVGIASPAVRESALEQGGMEARDTAPDEADLRKIAREQAHERRLLAQCDGIDIYSPISQDELTGIVMHQASYGWARVMTTQLPSADLTVHEASGKPIRVNNAQTEGEWSDADIAHLYRETDSTPIDTAADVGGEARTTVYAPVTGEVIAVTDYDLYDQMPDVRIHIRPDSNPERDVVVLHQTDPAVKAGDRVEAGVTPISKVRDLAAELTDLQLAYYTATSGNHAHVQVNDLTDAAYTEKYGLPRA